MNRTGNLMETTLTNLDNLLKNAGGSHMCALICFVVLAFIVLYYILR